MDLMEAAGNSKKDGGNIVDRLWFLKTSPQPVRTFCHCFHLFCVGPSRFIYTEFNLNRQIVAPKMLHGDPEVVVS